MVMTLDRRGPSGRLFLAFAYGRRPVSGFIHNGDSVAQGRDLVPRAWVVSLLAA